MNKTVKQPMRRQWTPSELDELWRRYRCGESVADIARALGRPAPTVHNAVAYRGGVPPAPRRRRACALSAEDREVISRELARGAAIRHIATQLARPPSTICREVNRNGGRFVYRANDAEARAWKMAERSKDWKLQVDDRLRWTVAEKLELEWSPEQISGWLKRRYPNNPRMHVSHETIYRSLFVQARGVLRAELLDCLRSRRRFRRHKNAGVTAGRRGPIIDGVSIRERPAEAQDRAVPGHWEGDLLIGGAATSIATLVERTSRFTMLVRLPARDSGTVVKALAGHIRRLPVELRRSLTWDRGSEMAQHKAFKIATDLQVYFCDPQSPWQRGTNENTNGLLRQYFPKGHSLADYTQTDLNVVARRLNQRPRKTLGFRTPAEAFNDSLNLLH